jgi:hypothetical protein
MTYLTILESADHALFKMVRYVLLSRIREMRQQWSIGFYNTREFDRELDQNLHDPQCEFTALYTISTIKNKSISFLRILQ